MDSKKVTNSGPETSTKVLLQNIIGGDSMKARKPLTPHNTPLSHPSKMHFCRLGTLKKQILKQLALKGEQWLYFTQFFCYFPILNLKSSILCWKYQPGDPQGLVLVYNAVLNQVFQIKIVRCCQFLNIFWWISALDEVMKSARNYF